MKDEPVKASEKQKRGRRPPVALQRLRTGSARLAMCTVDLFEAEISSLGFRV